MGRDDDEAVAGGRPQGLPDPRRVDGIELGGRLVAEGQARPQQEPRHRDPHPLAAGEVFRPRPDRGIEAARQLKADGVVWFCHWGCKHTLGGAQLAKKRFEEAGIPCLILDGDGCDRSHGGEGQLMTRMEAFVEMLEREKEAKS